MVNPAFQCCHGSRYRHAASSAATAAIASLDTSLQERDIEYWLFGGWAVDFWVGSVTRDALPLALLKAGKQSFVGQGRAEAAKDRVDLAALAKVADIPKLE